MECSNTDDQTQIWSLKSSGVNKCCSFNHSKNCTIYNISFWQERRSIPQKWEIKSHSFKEAEATTGGLRVVVKEEAEAQEEDTWKIITLFSLIRWGEKEKRQKTHIERSQSEEVKIGTTGCKRAVPKFFNSHMMKRFT